MRSLAQFSELALKRYFGGQLTADRLITARQVDIHVLQARDALTQETIAAKMATGDGYIDAEYLTTIDGVEMLWDTAKDVAYSILPHRPATLPKGKGVYSIHGLQGSNRNNQIEFLSIEPGSWFTKKRWLEGNIAYEYMGGVTDASGNAIYRVEYKNMAQQNIAPVTIQMVSTDAPADRNQPIHVPSYMEEAVLLRTVAIMKDSGKFDSANDQ